MTETTIENLIPWTQLGLSAVFLIMLYVSWRYFLVERKENNDRIVEKDREIKDMHSQVIEVVKDNTKAHLVSAEVGRAQVEATKNLSQLVYDALIKK